MHRYTMFSFIGGSYDIRHGLGLGQVHPAVDEGPAGELARLCRDRPRLRKQIQQTLNDVRRSMARDLRRILTCV